MIDFCCNGTPRHGPDSCCSHPDIRFCLSGCGTNRVRQSPLLPPQSPVMIIVCTIFKPTSAFSANGWNWQGSSTNATTTIMPCVGTTASPPNILTKTKSIHFFSASKIPIFSPWLRSGFLSTSILYHSFNRRITLLKSRNTVEISSKYRWTSVEIKKDYQRW